MNKRFDESRISEAMKKDLQSFRSTGMDAIYWMGNGFDVTTDEVIVRLQTADIDEVALSGLDTLEGWAASKDTLTDVRASLPPMSTTGKYSSYTLKERDYTNIRYPLVDSFRSKTVLFNTRTFPTYKDLINKIQKVYKVKVQERSLGGPFFQYKRTGKIRAMLKNVGLGIVNRCRRLFKKNEITSEPHYKGKITIGTHMRVNGTPYKISEQEKFTKIMDAIGDVTVKKTAKSLKVKLSKEELFVSRIYCDILVSRAINYGDAETNKKVEASLRLQLSNALAGLDLTPAQIKQVANIGLESAIAMIEKLGLSLDDVKASVKAAGYVYSNEPATIREAILPKRSLESVVEMEEEPEHIEQEVVDPPYQPNWIFVGNEARHDNVDVVDDAVKTLPEPTNIPLISEKKELPAEDIKENPTEFLTANKAKKYIDDVVLNNIKKQIVNITKNLKNIEATAKNINGVAWQRKIAALKRQNDFLEHVYTFYAQNRDMKQEDLNNLIQNELSIGENNDNAYAHSFGKSFVDLRKSIVDGIFGGEERVAIQGGDAASVINKYMKDNFYAETPRVSSLLSSYVAETLSTKVTKIFEMIDTNEFVPVDLTK